MNKDLERVIKVPQGVTVEVNGDMVRVSANGKSLSKKYNLYGIDARVDGDAVVLSSKGASRRQAKMLGTNSAHIKNMIAGVTDGFTYKMEICHVHFPMNVKAQGDTIVIKSFLGEKTDRVAKILPSVTVDIKGSSVTISSADIEAAGQTAANIEKATRLKNRDRRIFQDGIFITEKPGRVI